MNNTAFRYVKCMHFFFREQGKVKTCQVASCYLCSPRRHFFFTFCSKDATGNKKKSNLRLLPDQVLDDLPSPLALLTTLTFSVSLYFIAQRQRSLGQISPRWGHRQQKKTWQKM